SDVDDADDGENEHTPELFGVRRKADQHDAEADDKQENRSPERAHRREPGEKFTVDQTVAIDRLGQNAAQSAARGFDADGNGAEHDADERAERREEAGQRQQAAALRSEQKKKHVLRRRALRVLADRLPRGVYGPHAGQDDDGEQDHETAAAEMVRQLFPKDYTHFYY